MNLRVFRAYMAECDRLGIEATFTGARAYGDVHKHDAAPVPVTAGPKLYYIEPRIEIPQCVRHKRQNRRVL
jgi:hypothetical protein